MKIISFLLLLLSFCIVTKKEEDKKTQETAAVVVAANQAQQESGNTEFSVVKGATEAHNKVRRAKGIPDLVWDAEVAKYSKSKVEYLANQYGCQFSHSAGPKLDYGENLFAGYSSAPNANDLWSVQNAIDSWMAEEQYYNYASNTCQSGKVCGHYTQVVWKNSKKLGCYKAVCPDNKGIVIGCNYDPPGNVVGEKPY